MLYDKRWDKQVKSDPLTLPSLIAWLEKQPASGSYDFCNPQGCVLCQYFQARGVKDPRVNPFDWRSGEEGARHRLPKGFNWIANGGSGGWTYGAALARAKALQG